METYDMPFSNGAFYIHNNITFFVRRQDPFNEYGLQDPYDYSRWSVYSGEQYSSYTIEDKKKGKGMPDTEKLSMNEDYLSVLMTKEREVATDLLKFTATDIINNCL